jgi:multiple sugar transport system ATP-binding protein
MRTEIAQIHNQFGSTSVYVTHDQVEAMTLADKVVVLRDGVIEQVGTPMEVFLNPCNIFVATFIGSPSMNIIEGRLFSDKLQIGSYELPRSLLSSVGCTEDLPELGLEVKVGIRPDFFNDKSFFAASDTTFNLNQIHIELVEPMGFDKEVLFQIGNEKLKARIDLRSDVSRGDTMELLIDLSRVLVFDSATEHRL